MNHHRSVEWLTTCVNTLHDLMSKPGLAEDHNTALDDEDGPAPTIYAQRRAHG